MFRGLWSIIYKEFFHTIRDRRTLFLLIMIPGVDMIMFGYAIDMNVKNIVGIQAKLDPGASVRDNASGKLTLPLSSP